MFFFCYDSVKCSLILIFLGTKFSVAPVRISNASDDDSDDEMLMRPLFERLGGCKNDSEKKVIMLV